jgi:hypothetical protein
VASENSRQPWKVSGPAARWTVKTAKRFDMMS